METEHSGKNGRVFERTEPVICYEQTDRLKVNEKFYRRLGEVPLSQRELVETIVIPARSGRAWKVPAGCICRFEVIDGPQVADVNVWSWENPRERFYSSKTRQIHATHLTTCDRLWSCFPYLRPLATIVADSIAYGFDEDNAGVHDVIGSRCDPYTNRLMTGEDDDHCCHSNLTRAVMPYRLTEFDVHDVFNVFMCTGFTRDSGQYFAKPSPARRGDFLEMFAEIDLLVALSTCPQGDVSVACGSGNQPTCYPLGAQIFRLPKEFLDGWEQPTPNGYAGFHGLHSVDRE